KTTRRTLPLSSSPNSNSTPASTSASFLPGSSGSSLRVLSLPAAPRSLPTLPTSFSTRRTVARSRHFRVHRGIAAPSKQQCATKAIRRDDGFILIFRNKRRRNLVLLPDALHRPGCVSEERVQ